MLFLFVKVDNPKAESEESCDTGGKIAGTSEQSNAFTKLAKSRAEFRLRVSGSEKEGVSLFYTCTYFHPPTLSSKL